MSAIQIQNIRKFYGKVEAVRGINLDIPEGKMTVLLGPSGCGKSTLLRMIAGLEDISSGDLLIGGKRANDLPPKSRGCAMVFQSYALYPHLTVRKNLSFPLEMARMSKDVIAKKVDRVAQSLDVVALLDRLPKQLSGGQRQRVSMGRAIIREPKVYLFDEPLSNLDASLRVKMRLEIAQLQKSLGATMVFVTHDQVEAMTLAHQIVVMRGGNIEQVATPLDLYRSPGTRFVASFIGSPSMNIFDVDAVSMEGGHTQMQLPDGSKLVIEVTLPETPAQIGIRPEHLRVTTQQKMPEDTELVFEEDAFQVVGVEHLGDRSFRYVDTKIGAIVYSMPADDTAAVGPLALSFSRKNLHFFSKDGRAIPSYISASETPGRSVADITGAVLRQ